MNNSKIAILILAGNPTKYHDFINALETGWVRDALDRGFKVFFYSGGHNSDVIFNSCEIRVTEDDAIENCYRKFIAAKNVLIKNFEDIELVFRTNVSSYIDIEIFIKYVKSANFTKDSYHGISSIAYKYSELFYGNRFLHIIFKFLKVGPVIHFYSGASMFIGINMLNSLSYINGKRYMIDDVEIGSQLKYYHRHDLKLGRIMISNVFNKINIKSYIKLREKEFMFHYKFKSNNRYVDAYRLTKFKDPLYRIDFLTYKDY